MRDLLPESCLLRDHMTEVIVNAYRSFGFNRIETPILEDLKRLIGGGGGENEKLIYKVMKRGEKLKLDQVGITEDDIADLGMRFDLTVPLVRFYSNNFAKLANPFKAIQIGSVFRAERAQKGRFRQFTQCDIDTIGVSSELAESELILATCAALGGLGFRGFSVRINDRRLLLAIAKHSGFSEDQYDTVFISLDKLDKVGLSVVS